MHINLVKYYQQNMKKSKTTAHLKTFAINIQWILNKVLDIKQFIKKTEENMSPHPSESFILNSEDIHLVPQSNFRCVRLKISSEWWVPSLYQCFTLNFRKTLHKQIIHVIQVINNLREQSFKKVKFWDTHSLRADRE